MFETVFINIKSYQDVLLVSRTDAELARLLETLRDADKNLFDRIIVSLKYFNLAFKLEIENRNSAVVMLVSAFESLLQTPPNSKGEGFAYAIKVHFGFNEDIAKWARALYSYRSKLVHGQPTDVADGYLDPKYRHANHFEVAAELFDACVLLVLSAYGFVNLSNDYKFRKLARVVNKIQLNSLKIGKILARKSLYSFSQLKANPERVGDLIYQLRGLSPNDSSGRELYQGLGGFLAEIYREWFSEYKSINDYHGDIDFRAHVDEVDGGLARLIEFFRSGYSSGGFPLMRKNLELFRRLVLGQMRFSGYGVVSPQGFHDFVDETVEPFAGMYWSEEA